MARIAIPDSVYRKIAALERGSEQAYALREFIASDVPRGHEVTHYEREPVEVRDGDGKPITLPIGALFAVTAEFIPDGVEIPDALKRKPRRG